MGRFDSFRRTVAELIDSSRDEEPNPRGYQGDERGAVTMEGGYLEHEPDQSVNDYYQLYKSIGVIEGSVNNFASEVMEPGWYITADSEDTVDELTEYFKNVAILSTENDVHASKLMREMIIQYEVRGTLFLEKVTDSEDRHQALYPLQGDTITIYTKPGKAMLPAPDDNDAEPLEGNGRPRKHPPTTEDGDIGAYVQFDDTDPAWDSVEEVVYTREDVIKWARHPDLGDARGTSRIATIAERADGLLQKLKDNDDAIKSKAWPQIIFNMGSEDNPWSRDEVQDFIEDYEEENLEPGTMVAVSGDVSTEEFAGETADIADDLNFDISMIMSGLPGPMYATGGFSENVAPAVAQAQQRQFKKEVRDMRRDLEQIFTPYLQEVAEDYDLDAADSVELHIGRPAGQVAPEDVEGSIIRYESSAGGGEGGQGSQHGRAPSGAPVMPQNPDGEGKENKQGSKSGMNTSGTQSAGQPADVMVDELAESFNGGLTDEELSDPRLVSTTDYESSMSDVVSRFLMDARRNAINDIELQYDDAITASSDFDSIIKSAIERALDDHDISAEAQPHTEDVIQKVLDTLGQKNHDPQMDVSFGVRHRQRSRDFSENVENQARQAAESMLNDIHTQLRRGAQHGEDIDTVAERVREQWPDAKIEQRADVIAHMEAQNAINTTKLAEYDRHPDIDGFKVINPCTTNTTPLCRDLGGCTGEHATVSFDSQQSVTDQLEEQVSDAKLFTGFRPLPMIPPFHFGCRSEIVPA